LNYIELGSGGDEREFTNLCPVLFRRVSGCLPSKTRQAQWDTVLAPDEVEECVDVGDKGTGISGAVGMGGGEYGPPHSLAGGAVAGRGWIPPELRRLGRTGIFGDKQVIGVGKYRTPGMEDTSKN
jgi:hypothetical protein